MGKKSATAPPSRITDERFASFETDPRFRLPSRKHAKTTLDKRFSGLLKDNDFTATASVDRYGRKIKSDSKKKALERLYQVEDDKEEEGGNEEDTDNDDNDNGKEIEVEDDDVVQRELRAADESLRKYDPAREGGFSSSEDDSNEEDDDDDDDDDDEDENEDNGKDAEADVTRGGDMRRLAREDVEVGEVTKRIAIVNLDWDHVKSTDLMALFTSFVPAGDTGKITSIAVYPSEFGKTRMQQEEQEGPPRELFSKKKKKKHSDEEEDDEEEESAASDSEAEEASIKRQLVQEGDDQDFDSDALRAYQLDRLRYYYAVMTCSSAELARALYEATDGTEYQSSSNLIDLRFVPDEVAFDEEPRDACDRVPEAYKPVEFVTKALQSSKVKLTWDVHPEEASRKDSIKRAFKGSRAEIDEQDLKAYLAGDSSDSEAEGQEEEETMGQEGQEGAEDGGQPKLSKKELARKKMREALGLSDEPTRTKAKDEPVGGMQITFTPALSGDSSSNKKKKKTTTADGEQEETTIEKYARKERERKEKKRQAAKAKRDGAEADDGLKAAGGDGEEEEVDNDDEEDLGFNDPFFTVDDDNAAAASGGGASKTAVRKEERRKKRAAREAAEAEDAAEKAHLAQVMAQERDDRQAEHLEHFNINDIMRAEKLRGKKKAKGKKGRRREDKVLAGSLQEDFRMDVRDDRFKAVFESHEFAIDPSNPRFKATEGMKKLLEEGRKKRKGGVEEDDREGGKKARAKR